MSLTASRNAGRLVFMRSIPILFIFCQIHIAFDMDNSFSETYALFPGLVALSKFKEQNCSYVHWCTIAGTGDFNTGTFSDQCCPPCSCEVSCLNENTCCPDYGLSVLLNVSVNSKTNASDVISSINDTDKRYISNNGTWKNANLSSGRVNDNTTLPTTCVKMQLLDDSPFRPRGIAYKTISVCTGASYDVKTRRLCEDYCNDTHSESLTSRYIPVQSDTSGHVYRNIYCFRCSFENATSDVKSWRARLVLRTTFYGYFFPSTSYMTLDEVFRSLVVLNYDLLAPANVLFEPSIGIESLDISQTCTDVDVKSCDLSKSYGEDVINACENFFWPVHVFISNKPPGHYVSYNNIACLFCNSQPDEQALCRGNTQADTHMYEMRLTDVTDVDVNERIDALFDVTGHNCNTGYAYDTIKDKCRKVYCPQNYIISNGNCVPLFDEVKGLQYGIYLKVDLKPAHAADESSKYAEVTRQIQQYFGQDSKFDVKEVNLWRADSNFEELIANVVLKTNETAYGQIETYIWRMLKASSATTIYNKLSMTPRLTRYSRGRVLKDERTKLMYRQIDVNGTLTPSRNVRILSPDQFCYRIQTSPDEIMNRIGKQFVIKTHGGDKLLEISFLYNDKVGLPLVCADEVLPMPSKNRVFDTTAVNDKVSVRRLPPVTVVGHVGQWSKDVAIGISVGVLCFMLAMVYVIRHRYLSRGTNPRAMELDTETSFSMERI